MPEVKPECSQAPGAGSRGSDSPRWAGAGELQPQPHAPPFKEQGTQESPPPEVAEAHGPRD